MFKMNTTTVLPYCALPLTCLWFDQALKIPFITKSNILRAIVDNTAHGTIACLSWLAVTGLRNMMRRKIFETFLCGIFACLIDLDHFVAAKSFHLKDALSLDKRPPLHSTSLLVLIVPCCILLSSYYEALQKIPYLVTVSVVSHHVRDGHRRGLWFWPIGSTKPIPYGLYLVIITTFPALISILTRKVRNKTGQFTINV